MAVESVVELADGRLVGVSDWGPSEAPPVVYCHGFPGNRFEPELARSIVERSELSVRVIAFDRPGYGLSTAVQDRQFLDWPGDVAEAADRLGLGEFSVLGASGGCPFALACGIRLADRVTRVGIVAGTGPLQAAGMRDAESIAGPSRFRLLRLLQWRLVAQAVKTGRIDRVVDRAVETMGEVDRRAMERPAVSDWFRTMFVEAFRQGGAAASLEGELYRHPWGFDPADLRIDAYLWHGAHDAWVPPATAAWLADRIPGARLVVWPQHGHFSWAASPEVVDVLTAMIE